MEDVESDEVGFSSVHGSESPPRLTDRNDLLEAEMASR